MEDKSIYEHSEAFMPESIYEVQPTKEIRFDIQGITIDQASLLGYECNEGNHISSMYRLPLETTTKICCKWYNPDNIAFDKENFDKGFGFQKELDSWSTITIHFTDEGFYWEPDLERVEKEKYFKFRGNPENFTFGYITGRSNYLGKEGISNAKTNYTIWCDFIYKDSEVIG